MHQVLVLPGGVIESVADVKVEQLADCLRLFKPPRGILIIL